MDWMNESESSIEWFYEGGGRETYPGKKWCSSMETAVSMVFLIGVIIYIVWGWVENGITLETMLLIG